MTLTSALGALLALVVAGCAIMPGVATSSSVDAEEVATAIATSSSGAGSSPNVAGRDAPPDAVLKAEGGDPALGQLGTHTWLGTGSDGPWLPGAPIAVGAGEPLTVAFQPAGDVASWRARYVPSAQADAQGADSLGEGLGTPAFHAPPVGRWTVEVQVTFLAGVGSASYFWRMEVE